MQNPLPELIARLTGKVRYIPDFEWNSSSWTYNAFRCLELAFGREEGIRAEATSFLDSAGRQYHAFHTLEAALMHFEGWVRGLVPRAIPVRVWIPMLQTPTGFPIPLSPYLFAIAFDASAGTGNNNTPLSHTVSGTNRFMVVMDVGDNTDTLSGITYNSVSLTYAQKIQYPADRYTYLYVLVAPSTGTNNVAVTGTSFNECGVMTYSGCAQTGQPDSSATLSAVSATVTLTTTAVAQNCWLSGYVYGGTWSSEGANTIDRSISGHRLHDSGGPRASGSQSLVVNLSGSSQHVGALVSIAPFVANTEIQYQSFKSNTSTIGGSLVIDKPLGLAVGDSMFAGIVGVTGTALAAPAGWTAVIAQTANTVYTTTFYKVADSSDVAASNFTFTGNTIYPMAGFIMRQTGTKSTGSFIDQSNSSEATGAGTSITSSGITPSVANTMFLEVASWYLDNANVTLSGYQIATDNPSPWTEVCDINAAGAANIHIGISVAYAYRPQTTGSGTATVTISGNTDNKKLQIINLLPYVTPTASGDNFQMGANF